MHKKLKVRIKKIENKIAVTHGNPNLLWQTETALHLHLHYIHGLHIPTGMFSMQDSWRGSLHLSQVHGKQCAFSVTRWQCAHTSEFQGISGYDFVRDASTKETVTTPNTSLYAAFAKVMS